MLPIHAAGYHSIDSKSVIDRVISSYIPTLKSLAHSRRCAASSVLPGEAKSEAVEVEEQEYAGSTEAPRLTVV